MIEVLRQPPDSLSIKEIPIVSKLIAQWVADHVNEFLVHVEHPARSVGAFERHQCGSQ